MAGIKNDVLFSLNADFSRAGAHTASESNGLVANAEMWIGDTALNAGGTHINKGTLVSPDNSIIFGYTSPNITAVINSAVIQDFHISPYIVNPFGIVNGASFTTIQSALDAANAAGGGAVYVQPGTYTENLTLFDNVSIIGAAASSLIVGAGSIVIVGVHAPPATGFTSIANCYLQSATHIFSSVAAGSTIILLQNCNTLCTNGFTYNLPNWTGVLGKFNNQDDSVDNGVVNNTGGALVFFESSNIGAGSGQTMVTSGTVHFNEVDIRCPWSAQTGTILDLDTVTFSSTLTLANNSTGTIRWGSFITGGSPAITMSSSAAIRLIGGIIDSSNNPAITGAGAGTFTYSDVSFLSNAAFAGTLTLDTPSWQPYARAIASTDGTKVGTAAFNSAQFTVDANGFVSAISTAFVWNDVSGAFSPLTQNGYFITGTATGTLPASPVQGDTIKFFVDHASQVLTIKAAGTQLIRLGSLVSSAGGTAVSTLQGDSVELVYRAANTTWEAVCGFSGTWVMA